MYIPKVFHWGKLSTKSEGEIGRCEQHLGVSLNMFLLFITNLSFSLLSKTFKDKSFQFVEKFRNAVSIISMFLRCTCFNPKGNVTCIHASCTSMYVELCVLYLLFDDAMHQRMLECSKLLTRQCTDHKVCECLSMTVQLCAQFQCREC